VLEQIRSAPDYELAWEANEPLVTIRVATRNRAELLTERALPSVLRQSYSNWECVVVGDHCTDDTDQRIKALGDERIRFLNLPYWGPYPDEPQARLHYVVGLHAMNAGLRRARGRWIAALDDDDEFAPDHLVVLLEHARQTKAELVYGRLRVVEASTGRPMELDISEWPPRVGAFNFLSSLMHSGLKRFEHDPNCHLAAEPADWNACRRMWEAGVRFSFLDREVGTYYFKRRVWP
jgi:glycosyltransferase involved in cell wall biosynthesis